MTNSITETIGCDLGDRHSAIYLLHGDDSVEQHRVPTTPRAMTEFFTRAPAHVVIEVGTHSRWVSELLKERGHRVTVANPRRVKAISESDSKSDERDAELLARLGRVDRKLLAPVEHRGREAQADLAVTKSRDVLVRCRTHLINYVRGVTKSFGKRLPKCSSESFHRKTQGEVPMELTAALNPIYDTLAELHERVRELDQVIERQLAKKYPEVEVIAQPFGVGVLTALVFLLTLEDKERFPKSRTVGAYLGLRPRRAQSGDDEPQLGITKSGDHYLRRLLVNSANFVLGPFGPDSDLRRWGLKLAERGGKSAKKRAIVAVARKLAVLMHRLWMTGEVYQPLGYPHRPAPLS